MAAATAGDDGNFLFPVLFFDDDDVFLDFSNPRRVEGDVTVESDRGDGRRVELGDERSIVVVRDRGILSVGGH